VQNSNSMPPTLRFGVFELDPRTGELRKKGMKIRLQGQPVEILVLLLQRPGDAITREELQKKLWPSDTFVDFEQGLNNAMNRLRAALDDDAESPHFIETLPRHGYRFIGAVNGGPRAGAEPTAQTEAQPVAGEKAAHHIRIGTKLVAVGLVGLAVAAALLLGLNVRGWRDRVFMRSPKPRIQALAVLPLTNLSGDPDQEYFADGMTEALITELGKTSIPRVISRQSVMQYIGSKKPVQQIARELNVDAVLEGTVVRSGDRVRVTIHLDRASPEGQLWASTYDRSVRDILGLQSEIARTVTDEVQVRLTPQERARQGSSGPVNREAHDEYLRGRYILGLAVTRNTSAVKRQYNEHDVVAAIGHFKHAIDIDPAYAMAYAGLADAHIQLGNPVWGGHSPKETLFDAKEAATKALQLDLSLPEAHFSLAQTLEYEWNWSEAEKEFKLALKLNPNYADAHLEYGRFLQAVGQNDEALREMNNAMALDPFGIKTRVVVAWVTLASHQYDLALQQFKSLGDDWGVMLAYKEREMYPEALAAWERFKLDHPAQTDPRALAVLAGIYGLQGKKHEAEELIDELKETARQQYVSGFFFAEAYVGLGQKGEAITWLERAYEEHDQWMVYVAAYPSLDPLHSEPRFQALLRRMNFPQ
jgi:TolB-like protein/DNA-binding winged helix-turn-helix (wHTH) protein